MPATTSRRTGDVDGEVRTRPMITPAMYGSVQVSLDTAFGDGRLWWNGAQWQAIPEDAKTAVKEFQRAVAAATRSRGGATALTLAGALYQLGNAEARRSRETQALAAYQDILKRFAGDADPALRGYAAAAGVARGNFFARKAYSTKPGERPRMLRMALAEYRAVIDRYTGDASPGMQVWVAEALVDSGSVYGSDAINDKASAVVHHDAALRRLASHSGPIAQRLTAIASENASTYREHLGLSAGATTPGSPDQPPVSPQSYGAVQISLDAFSTAGHQWWDGAQWLPLPDDARAATKELQRAIAATGQSPGSSTNVALAGALYEIGNAQSRLGRESQALSAYDDILKRFSADPDPALQGYVAAAMCGKGHLFAMKAARGRPNSRPSVLRQALTEYRAVIDRYSNDPNPGFQVWVAKAMVDSGQVFGGEVLNDRAMAIVYCGAASKLLRLHTGVLAQRVAAAAGLNCGLFLAQLGLNSDAIAVTREMVATFGDALDPTIRGYVATARNNIANWETAGQVARSPSAATPSPKRSANAAAGVLVGLLFAGVIALVAVPAFIKALNNTTGSSAGSLSSGSVNPGGSTGGNPGGGNPGGSVVAPAPAAAAPHCQQSNFGSAGGFSLHHMVDTTSTAPCWAHEIVDLGPGCSFFLDGQQYQSAPVNIWNIVDWGYGSGDTAGEYMFQTAGHQLIYSCVQNGTTYPQTTLNSVDW